MNNLNDYYKKTLSIGATSTLLMPSICAAAAPVYFDLGGLIIFALLYLFGLIAIPVGVVCLKLKNRGLILSCFFIVYVLTPLLLIAPSRQANRTDQQLSRDQSTPGYNEIREICQQRDIQVFETVSNSHPRGVKAIETKHLNFQMLRDNDDLPACILEGIGKQCVKANIDFYDKEVKVLHPYFYRYSMPKKDAPIRPPSANGSQLHANSIESSDAKYALVFGNEKDSVSSTSRGSEIKQSWIQLLRVVDQKVIAETSIYFLNGESGQFGCPSLAGETSKMLQKVFGKSLN